MNSLLFIDLRFLKLFNLFLEVFFFSLSSDLNIKLMSSLFLNKFSIFLSLCKQLLTLSRLELNFLIKLSKFILEFLLLLIKFLTIFLDLLLFYVKNFLFIHECFVQKFNLLLHLSFILFKWALLLYHLFFLIKLS